tara:strand:+ start:203 stop:1186 length:984 start_codon:yes stop_codon:yes gene_type:complete
MSMKLMRIAALATTLVMAGSAVAGAQTVLKFACGSAQDTPEVQAAMRFADIVAEQSDGKYKIDVQHSGQAGGEREIAEGQQLGAINFAILGGIVQNFDPALMIVEWDMLFKNNEHVQAALNGDIGERISARMVNALNARPIAHLMRTPRILTTKKPVGSLEDLSGMKIRVPEMPARLAIWKALGAAPTPMSFTEVVPALQLGTIDGQENPVAVVSSNNLQEVVKYLTKTNHLYGFMFLTVSEPFWQGLSDEDRTMFSEAAAQAAAYNDELSARSEGEIYEDLSSKMEISDIDLAPWREATKDVYKQFSDVDGFTELYTDIVKLGEKF